MSPAAVFALFLVRWRTRLRIAASTDSVEIEVGLIRICCHRTVVAVVRATIVVRIAGVAR